MWWIAVIISAVAFIAVLTYGIGIPMFHQWRCPHLNTRCLHGDEINMASSGNKVVRQRCLDCGKALDRPAICTVTGKDIHEWHGNW